MSFKSYLSRPSYRAPWIALTTLLNLCCCQECLRSPPSFFCISRLSVYEYFILSIGEHYFCCFLSFFIYFILFLFVILGQVLHTSFQSISYSLLSIARDLALDDRNRAHVCVSAVSAYLCVSLFIPLSSGCFTRHHNLFPLLFLYSVSLFKRR